MKKSIAYLKAVSSREGTCISVAANQIQIKLFELMWHKMLYMKHFTNLKLKAIQKNNTLHEYMCVHIYIYTIKQSPSPLHTLTHLQYSVPGVYLSPAGWILSWSDFSLMELDRSKWTKIGFELYFQPQIMIWIQSWSSFLPWNTARIKMINTEG